MYKLNADSPAKPPTKPIVSGEPGLAPAPPTETTLPDESAQSRMSRRAASRAMKPAVGWRNPARTLWCFRNGLLAP